MHPHAFTLLRHLADGQFHSGADLANQLEVSRTTVWQRIGELQAQGIPIDCVRGRGYHLARQIELLDIEALRFALQDQWVVHYEPVVESTMDSWDKQVLPHAEVSIAELQLAGRGRQGRRWVNPFASTLTFSVTWQFQSPMTQLSGLSLAVGVMVRRACQNQAIALKWPNDLQVAGNKLGGILIELRGEMQGPCTAIIGIGLNIAMNKMDATAIERPWCDLASISERPSRNAILQAILQQLHSGLTTFALEGFLAFQDEWMQADGLLGKQITLGLSEGDITGVVRGVDATGHLILEQAGLTRLYASGEIVHVKNIHQFA